MLNNFIQMTSAKAKYLLLAIGSIFATNGSAQNVGIGTTTPAAKLDVNSPSTFISRFNSSTNQGFITVAENGIARAYIGSYAGAAEDVDFGTTASNLPGKLHLTIQSNPKLTIDNSGNVGVGTISPTEKLEVSGNLKMAGEIKPSGAAGLAGQVLTSNGNGTMQWAQAQTQSGTEIVDGNGTWGDCSVNNIEAYQPVADEDGQPVDYFGSSVSISGDFAIIGAPEDNENGLFNNGSAIIFKRNATSGAWESQGKIYNPNAENQDIFGSGVSISGDYAIIGAYRDSEGGFSNNGSATIFKRNTTSGVWEPQGKLTNPNAASDDYFGYSVGIHGDYAIVGAIWDDEGGKTDCGSATIFKRNSTTGVWESQGKLINTNADHYDNFGITVSINGDYAIVGADLDDEGFSDNGSATIFKRNSGTGVWESQGKMTNSNAAANDFFGRSVSISGDYAIVGAFGDDETGLTDNGSAIIFKRNVSTGVWEYSGNKLININASQNDFFGINVSISGDFVIVGATADDDDGLLDKGSATIYRRYGNNWRPLQKFSDPNGAQIDYFGKVAIDGSSRRFLVGSIGVNSNTGMAFFGKIK